MEKQEYKITLRSDGSWSLQLMCNQKTIGVAALGGDKRSFLEAMQELVRDKPVVEEPNKVE